MTVAIDTKRYADFWNGDAEVVHTLEHCETIYIPFIVLAELRVGFLSGSRQAANERTLNEFLQKPTVQMLFATSETTSLYAVIYRQLKQQGTPIPTNDVWIASLALEHHVPLYTRDAHFDRIPQLQRA